MASSWFDQSYYLSAKAAYNNAHATGGLTTWTATSVQAAFNAAGITPEQHYTQYGWIEGLSPDAYYVESQYVTSKVAALNAGAFQGKTTWTSADFYSSLNGSNPFMHYVQYGAYETGVEPSTGFDDDTYYTDKAAYNNAHNVNGITTWTAATVMAAFQAAGLTPIGHYELYGQTEAFYTPTPTPVPGQTYTLTTNIDDILGTSGNDVFLGTQVAAGGAAPGSTFNPGDQLDGGSGTDTFKIYGSTSTDSFGAGSIKNIEVVENYTGAALNVSANAGVKEAWVMKTGAFATTATVSQIIGYSDESTAGANVATFTNVAGAADSATVAFSNAGKTTALTSVAVAGVETLTVAAAGTNDIAKLNIDATKLVLTGAGTFKSEIFASSGAATSSLLKTIDASANTGGFNINNFDPAAATTDTITGGSGNDRYVTKYANLTSADKINLGGGVNTLAFGDAAAFTTAAQVLNYGGVTNVQTLGSAGAATLAVDAALLPVSGFDIQSTGAYTLTNAIQGTTVTTDAQVHAASTVGLALGATTLNLNLEGSTTAVSANTLAVTGSSIININSSGKGFGANTLALTAADNQSSVKLTGAADLTLTTTAATGTTGWVIDGSTATGKLNITGTLAADVIKGGSAVDTFTFGASKTDAVTGGGSNDVFNFTAATNLGTANMVNITDFTKGDKADVKITAAGAFTATKIDVSGAANLDAAIALADTTATNLTWFNYGTDTYMVGAGANAAVITDDTIVKLSGALDLSTSVFSAGVLTFA